MDVDEEMSEVFYSKLLELEKDVRRRMSQRNSRDIKKNILVAK